jgi:hypothetical protein
MGIAEVVYGIFHSLVTKKTKSNGKPKIKIREKSFQAEVRRDGLVSPEVKDFLTNVSST